MMKYCSLLLILLLMLSCGSPRIVVQTRKTAGKHPRPTAHVPKTPTVPKSNTNGNAEILEATTSVKVTTEMVLAYIDKYKEVAKKNMTQFGIPSSIILAQGILESGAGTGPLSSQANNHFGIKCHKEWSGPSVKYDDDTAQECFRKYEQPMESYKDHSLFLTSRTRYSSLFTLEKNDYKGWANGLKAAGYATDVKYPSKLIGIIERYQLHQYDKEVLGNNEVSKPTNQSIALNSSQYQVMAGDTLYGIAKKFNLSVDELRSLNKMSDNAIAIGQYLKVK